MSRLTRVLFGTAAALATSTYIARETRREHRDAPVSGPFLADVAAPVDVVARQAPPHLHSVQRMPK